MDMATLNLAYDRGADTYSDGPIEDELLEIVRQKRPALEVLATDTRWPLLCHLSPERRNLLEWFPFAPEAALLEIGAGCGALTGLFCERVARVTAVELTRKRSEILLQRYHDTPNLEIVTGNVMELTWPGAFDYVTLIGVLEYARTFVAGPQPYRALLEKAAAFLKPDGRLLLAIENKFGLKYFAGAREDHTGRSFDGIEGYPVPGAAETFSKAALSAHLRAAGFTRLQFYYPYPDYKFPTEIFSDAWLPEAGHPLPDAPNYDQERYRLFSEKKAWRTIIADGRFDFFANAFLVVAEKPG